MTPLEYLQEEYQSVYRALKETLRHEYAQQQNNDFYDECVKRLDRIGAQIRLTAAADVQAIAANLTELGHVATWISLIERSYLGEFSWPFALELRELASELLSEKQLDNTIQSPIIHVVSEAWGYRIINEEALPLATSGRRFVIIQFPRSLKYHVLLHAIFGHELGHAALESTMTGAALRSQVEPALCGHGVLESESSVDGWLYDQGAPSELKSALAAFTRDTGIDYLFQAKFLRSWQVEFIADLCGLLLFGPAFAASFKALLKPKHPNPLKINLLGPTHPPYACRSLLIAQALRILGWDKAIADRSDSDVRNAEKDLLVYLVPDAHPPWSKLFSDDQVSDALAGIKSVFGNHVYVPPPPGTLARLVRRLSDITPPILETIAPDGTIELSKIPFTQMLYAGWVYWVGRARLQQPEELSFFDTNRLCNHAMIQQQAINRALK